MKQKAETYKFYSSFSVVAGTGTKTRNVKQTDRLIAKKGTRCFKWKRSIFCVMY